MVAPGSDGCLGFRPWAAPGWPNSTSLCWVVSLRVECRPPTGANYENGSPPLRSSTYTKKHLTAVCLEFKPVNPDIVLLVLPMKVIIVGAGLGGLACAISCRREGLDVLLLERAPKILPVSRHNRTSRGSNFVDSGQRSVPAFKCPRMPRALPVVSASFQSSLNERYSLKN